MDYEIRHQLPGRLRLRLAALSDGAYRREVEETLLSEKRIQAVRIAVLARSVTINYRPGSLTVEEILNLLDPEGMKAKTAPKEAAPVESSAVEAVEEPKTPEPGRPVEEPVDEPVARAIETLMAEERQAEVIPQPKAEALPKPAKAKAAPKAAATKSVATKSTAKEKAGKKTGKAPAVRGKGKPAEKDVKPKAAAKPAKGKPKNG